MPAARDRYMAYLRGWRDGTGHSGQRPEFLQHPDADLRAAYDAGYIAGTNAKALAQKEASERYEYWPSPLRGQVVVAGKRGGKVAAMYGLVAEALLRGESVLVVGRCT